MVGSATVGSAAAHTVQTESQVKSSQQGTNAVYRKRLEVVQQIFLRESFRKKTNEKLNDPRSLTLKSSLYQICQFTY